MILINYMFIYNCPYTSFVTSSSLFLCACIVLSMKTFQVDGYSYSHVPTLFFIFFCFVKKKRFTKNPPQTTS